jgi:hypothetical protein
MPDDPAPLVRTLTADGFVVVAAFRDPKAVLPPRRIVYTYDHHAHLNDAADAYAAYERGEYAGFSAVGLFPVRCGLPFGPALGALELARLVRETEAA